MSEAPRATDLPLDDLAALGTEIADLMLAAVAARSTGSTVADYLTAIAPTFNPGTAATYAPYWRLTTTHLGDRRLSEETVVDLHAVVADAAVRAKRRRATSGRASQETCVAALRALFSRARAAGLIRTDPAALAAGDGRWTTPSWPS